MVLLKRKYFAMVRTTMQGKFRKDKFLSTITNESSVAIPTRDVGDIDILISNSYDV